MNYNDKAVTIYSLNSVLEHLKSTNSKNPIVFFDYDDCLIDPDTDKILEPRETKELFDYLMKNRIHFSVVTARFYDTVTNHGTINLKDMEENIKYTIHPILETLGLNTKDHSSLESTDVYFPITTEKGDMVGIMYQGIFFGDKKGEIIKHYMRMAQLHDKKDEIIFVDDYEPYIQNVLTHIPHATVFRRRTYIST